MTHPLFSDRSFWYENPAWPASSAGWHNGESYGDLGGALRAVMRGMTTAAIKAAGLAAYVRGDFPAAAAFEREYLRRMTWAANYCHVRFGGGR